MRSSVRPLIKIPLTSSRLADQVTRPPLVAAQPGRCEPNPPRRTRLLDPSGEVRSMVSWLPFTERSWSGLSLPRATTAALKYMPSVFESLGAQAKQKRLSPSARCRLLLPGFLKERT